MDLCGQAHIGRDVLYDIDVAFLGDWFCAGYLGLMDVILKQIRWENIGDNPKRNTIVLACCSGCFC